MFKLQNYILIPLTINQLNVNIEVQLERSFKLQKYLKRIK